MSFRKDGHNMNDISGVGVIGLAGVRADFSYTYAPGFSPGLLKALRDPYASPEDGVEWLTLSPTLPGS